MKIIPVNIAPEILREREREGIDGRKYRINRTAPAVLLFCELKNLSKSGFVKYLEGESKTNFQKRISKSLGISFNTFASRIRKLINLGLVEQIDGSYIRLSSWKKLCTKFLVQNEGFHEVANLDIETLYKLLIVEKKGQMSKAVSVKYSNLVAKYPNLLDSYTTDEMTLEKLEQIQKFVYINGTDKGQEFINLLYSINPRLECGCEGWRLESFHKRPSSVFYWLKKLVKRKEIKYTRAVVLETKKRVHFKFSKWNKSKKIGIWPQTGRVSLETPMN